MKAKELEQLVKGGGMPIIKLTSDVGDYDGPNGQMIGRVKRIGEIEKTGPGESVISFIVDFFEFHDYNLPLMSSDWYDSNRNPTLKWAETKGYEEDSKSFEIYVMYTESHEDSELDHIEITEENPLLNEYLKSGSELTYVMWLEEKLTNVLSK